jgi:G:T-mismatch repair DNA endonuclease (very short patch repair protein)
LLQGWRVAVVWECALRRSSETTLAGLHEFVLSDRSFHEFSSA